MLKVKAKMEADGIEAIGPTDHTIFQSIYFRDPSGHRLELAADTATPKMNQMLDEVKWTCSTSGTAPKGPPRMPAGCTTAATPINCIVKGNPTPMKLATLQQGGRDGTLVVVSRDLRRCRAVPAIARTLLAAMDDWATAGAATAPGVRSAEQRRHRRRAV